MAARLTKDSIKFLVTPYSAASVHLAAFFKVRYEVYTEFGLSYYHAPEATKWDKTPGARFLLLLNAENGEVVGGRRIIIHEPKSGHKVYGEANTHYTIGQMLPHLDTENMRYAEFGSLCFARAARGNGISDVMYEQSFAIMRREKVDFIVSNPVPRNVERLYLAAVANGAKQVVWRRDVVTMEDGDRDPTMFISFKGEDELPLLSPEMKASGVGKIPPEIMGKGE